MYLILFVWHITTKTTQQTDNIRIYVTKIGTQNNHINIDRIKNLDRYNLPLTYIILYNNRS